eukprot:GDKI01031305.1.p1 GENE.GDKI01031305.1~~GDKI01031305.1.p1  ORF type:complete len:145 (-),score=20.99 GDKI01031305.1:196-630(-)
MTKNCMTKNCAAANQRTCCTLVRTNVHAGNKINLKIYLRIGIKNGKCCVGTWKSVLHAIVNKHTHIINGHPQPHKTRDFSVCSPLLGMGDQKTKHAHALQYTHQKAHKPSHAPRSKHTKKHTPRPNAHLPACQSICQSVRCDPS